VGTSLVLKVRANPIRKNDAIWRAVKNQRIALPHLEQLQEMAVCDTAKSCGGRYEQHTFIATTKLKSKAEPKYTWAHSRPCCDREMSHKLVAPSYVLLGKNARHSKD
jgi:hypothetical protein